MKIQKRSFTIIILIALTWMFVGGCIIFSGTSSNQSGSFALADPTVGLKSLKSYHASFRQDVTGTLDGKPFKYQTHIELSRLPGKMDFTRELGGSEETASYFHVITDGKTIYRWDSAGQSCQGEAGQLAVGETRDPASLLFHITGATKKGSEVVNQIPTTHYQFDQNNLHVSDPKPEVKGDLWMADQGGYVVKFALTIAPTSNPSGKGLETGQNWTYEISRVNTVDSIELPKDCLPVLVEIPTLPDAQEIYRNSGQLSFITSSQASEVVDLYFKALPALGWKTDQKKPDGDLTLPVSLIFAKGDQKLVVNIDNSAHGGLDVDILIHVVEAALTSITATPGASLPTIPAATVNPVQSGLPEDIPLYPGATGMLKMENAFTVNSADPVDSVVNFYLKKMPVLGWKLMNNIATDGTTVLMWQKQSAVVTISVTPDSGETKIIIVQ